MKKIRTIPFFILKVCFLSVILFCISNTQLDASSHREAPLIAGDPLADNTDLYAFRSPDNPNTITIIANYIPMQLPQGGPNYYSFGENIRYEIHVDNDAGTPGDEIIYRFTFQKVNEDETTFFNIRLGAQNLKTSYTIERSLDGGNSFQTILTDGVVPPPNIGPRSIASAIGLGMPYEDIFNNAITQTTTGETVFAGPVDDPFFVDLGGIFDLGDAPRQNSAPRDGLAKYNVHSIALQVPISTLLKSGAASSPANILDGDYVIGVWASASRPAITTMTTSDDLTYTGDWVQVSRLGMPLTNEAVIPIGQKDYWNRLSPHDEFTESTLDNYFYNPELALFMVDPETPEVADLNGTLFTSSNNAQEINLLLIDNGNQIDESSFMPIAADADGIYYDKANDVLYHLNRTDNVVNAYSDVLAALSSGSIPQLTASSSSDFSNGREIAVSGDQLIVAQDDNGSNGGNKLIVYQISPSSITLQGIYDVAENLWGIHLNTDQLFAIEDNSDRLLVYNSIFNQPFGNLTPDQVVTVSGIVRTHGITYYAPTDQMFLTDVGDAGSDTDGAFTVINNYTTAASDDLIDASEQFRIDGNNTFLGNPVDIAFDPINQQIYIAERANSSGRLLGFNVPTSNGNVAPTYNTLKAGISAVYYNRSAFASLNNDIVFTSSNNSGFVNLFDDLSGNIIPSYSFESSGSDADGIFYDASFDAVYQLDRSSNVVNAYQNVSMAFARNSKPLISATSTSDFSNGREIAVVGNKLIVAQDDNGSNGGNKLIVYNVSPTSITLDRIFDVAENLWGIHLNGTELYAIEDNSDRLLVYYDVFNNPAGNLSPSAVIQVEGIVRTHGITYSAAGDIMVLTDVGAASSDTDGAFSIINCFNEVSSDGFISLNEQIRVAGSNTLLGNPVDVAYNNANGNIYIAERANGGGRLLTFNVPAAGGNIVPASNIASAGISAVFLNQYFNFNTYAGAVPAFDPLRIQSSSLGAFDFRNGSDGLYVLKGNPALDGTALDDNIFGTLLLPGPAKPRSVDLWPAFHTGVPNVIPYQLATGKNGDPLAAGKPFVNNFLPNGGDMLRLNMAVPPTPRNDANFSSLGLIQAAVLGLTAAPYNTSANLEFIPNMDGFPNGRRLEDDVTRIELQAVAGIVLAAVGLWYDDYDPMNSASPVTNDLLNVLGYSTGVESNDAPFSSQFPYQALPWSGTEINQ